MKRLLTALLMSVAAPVLADGPPIEDMTCDELKAAVAALATVPVAGEVAAAKRAELQAAVEEQGCAI
jgi:hypothetical protein